MTLQPDQLRVPFAYDPEGHLVRPAAAFEREHYRCPGCDQALRVRGGTQLVQVHFAHVSATATCRLYAEGWLHFWTKLTAFEAVKRHLSGAAVLLLQGRCGRCHDPLMPRPLPSSVEDARIEMADERSGRRVDIALLRGTAMIAAIEICDTNPVSAEKDAVLSVPWLEVHAGNAPLVGDVLRIDRERPLRTCAACKSSHHTQALLAHRAAAARSAELLRAEQERIEELRREAELGTRFPRARRLRIWSERDPLALEDLDLLLLPQEEAPSDEPDPDPSWYDDGYFYSVLNCPLGPKSVTLPRCEACKHHIGIEEAQVETLRMTMPRYVYCDKR